MLKTLTHMRARLLNSVSILLGLSSHALAQGYPPPYAQPTAQPYPPVAPAQPYYGPTQQQPQQMQPMQQPGPGSAPNSPSAPPTLAPTQGWAVPVPPPTQADAATPSAPEAGETVPVDHRPLHNNLWGSTGWLRLSEAGSSSPGTFRVSLLTDWFSTSGFLCDPSDTTDAGTPKSCGPNFNSEETTSHVGATLALSATPLSFLEAYLSARTFANSNDIASPQLLQVLGDTTIGIKGFLPNPGLFGVGAEAQLFLLNGTGDVGFAGNGTSFALRALLTADFARKPGLLKFPLKATLNLGYKFDNSGNLVEDIESERATAFDDGRTTQPISRVERFGLGINRVDFFQVGFGASAPFQRVEPFFEWTIDAPVNRQGYECSTKAVSQGDVCLGLADFSSTDPENDGGPGAAAAPSRLTLGARVTPFTEAFSGLSGQVALDIATGGSSTFVEEVAPQAPWTLYLGLGFAAGVDDGKAVETKAPEAQPVLFLRGFVHEKGSEVPVSGAIVSFAGVSTPPVATGPNGRFLSRPVAKGSHTLEVAREGYHPGTCVATAWPGVKAPVAAHPGALPTPPPVLNAWGQPQGGSLPAPPVVGLPTVDVEGAEYFDVDCVVEPLPKVGGVVGLIKDDEGGLVSGAAVIVKDSAGREFRLASDATGTFKAAGLPLGAASVRVEAAGFSAGSQDVTVEQGKDLKITLILSAKPAEGSVRLTKNEIKVSQRIEFAPDSANIESASLPIIEEVAELLKGNPTVRIEIQAHTDSSGSGSQNQTLSEARAKSVRDRIVAAGIAPGRLVAKGYGQDQPLVPNVTKANRAKNRRVEFKVIKK